MNTPEVIKIMKEAEETMFGLCQRIVDLEAEVQDLQAKLTNVIQENTELLGYMAARKLGSK